MGNKDDWLEMTTEAGNTKYISHKYMQLFKGEELSKLFFQMPVALHEKWEREKKQLQLSLTSKLPLCAPCIENWHSSAITLYAFSCVDDMTGNLCDSLVQTKGQKEFIIWHYTWLFRVYQKILNLMMSNFVAMGIKQLSYWELYVHIRPYNNKKEAMHFENKATVHVLLDCCPKA